MGGVYLTVLYLQRLEKLRTGENFSPIGHEKFLFSWTKSAHTPEKCMGILLFRSLGKQGKGFRNACCFSKENKANRNSDQCNVCMHVSKKINLLEKKSS